ncbi:MAG: hypothetical protein LBD85_04100 [Oscillospiraceae bacterium]|jgi:membrane-bound serine protease (ClpP class)|nr:hypothetical protein [Oscillospiraceae bacterium]
MLVLALSGAAPAAIVFLIVGIVLITAECFIPGFGVFGILGIVSLIASIILFSDAWWQAAVMIVILLALVITAVALLSRLAAQGKLQHKLFLSISASSALGFDSTRDYSGLVGFDGVSQTILRPAGVAVIRGARYDVVTQGEYIEKGVRLTVLSVEGNRIVVEKKA